MSDQKERKVREELDAVELFKTYDGDAWMIRSHIWAEEFMKPWVLVGPIVSYLGRLRHEMIEEKGIDISKIMDPKDVFEVTYQKRRSIEWCTENYMSWVRSKNTRDDE